MKQELLDRIEQLRTDLINAQLYEGAIKVRELQRIIFKAVIQQEHVEYDGRAPLEQRLSELEQDVAKLMGDPLHNVAAKMGDTWVVEKRTAEAIQAAVKAGSGERSIIPEETIRKQAERIVRMTTVSSGGDYSIFIDKNASPENIPFSVALEYLKAGRRVARRAAGWDMSATTGDLVDYLHLEDTRLLKNHYRTDSDKEWEATASDILALDWEVISEQ